MPGTKSLKVTLAKMRSKAKTGIIPKPKVIPNKKSKLLDRSYNWAEENDLEP